MKLSHDCSLFELGKLIHSVINSILPQGTLIWNLHIVQVEKSSYVWLPLLPRLDGRGYELVYAEKWSPSDYYQRARIPVLYNNGTNAEGVIVGPSMPSAQGLSSQGSSASEPAGAAAEVRSTLSVCSSHTPHIYQVESMACSGECVILLGETSAEPTASSGPGMSAPPGAQVTPSKPPAGWQAFASRHNTTVQARLMTPTLAITANNTSNASTAPAAPRQSAASTASSAAQVSSTETMARKIADTLSVALSG